MSPSLLRPPTLVVAIDRDSVAARGRGNTRVKRAGGGVGGRDVQPDGGRRGLLHVGSSDQGRQSPLCQPHVGGWRLSTGPGHHHQQGHLCAHRGRLPHSPSTVARHRWPSPIHGTQGACSQQDCVASFERGCRLCPDSGCQLSSLP